jgi:hypothetical protein
MKGRGVALIVAAVAGLPAASAAAAPSTRSLLGPPTTVTAGASDNGHILVRSTAQCPGFAAGDTLRFDAVTVAGRQLFWATTPGGAPFFGFPATDELWNYQGTTSAGGQTYTITGHFSSGPAINEDFFVTGFARVTRSDGHSISGPATLLADDLTFPYLALSFVQATCT